MRSRTAKARQFEPGGDLRGTAVAALRSHRFDPLSLPVFDQQAIQDLGTSKEAAFALHWLDAGYLDESMSDLSATTLVKIGFERWIEKWLGETPYLCSMVFAYTLSGDMYSHNEREQPDDWLFSIDQDAPDSRFLEPRFNVIEQKAPGLFQTAIGVYESVVGRIGLAGTPETVRSMAGYELWCGTDTHEDFVEELNDMGYSEEDIETMLTPNDYRSSLPAWLLCPQPSEDETEPQVLRPMLTDDALTALAETSDPEIADIATSVLALKGCKEALDDAVLNVDAAPIYLFSLLRWNEDDQVRRAYDDIVQRANECGDGYSSELTEEWVGSDSESFQQWRERYESVFTALKQANKLIELLSVPDDSD